MAGMRVLDVGAGGGRHAIDCARRGATVHAVDCSGSANAIHETVRSSRGLDNRISITQATIGVSSLPDDSYDLIVDSYASCHVLDLDERLQLLDGLLGCLSIGGRLYTSGMGSHDQYYRQHLVESSTEETLSCDPLNGITKRLQSAAALRTEHLAVGIEVAHTIEHFADRVDGRPWRREVHAAVLCR